MKITPQMYQRDAVAYESLMLGTFSLWYNQMPAQRIPKINRSSPVSAVMVSIGIGRTATRSFQLKGIKA
jgi:hypothetical protein